MTPRPPTTSPASANKRTGRPPRAGTTSGELVRLRVTADERRVWKLAAGERSLSEWLRDLANQAAATAARVAARTARTTRATHTTPTQTDAATPICSTHTTPTQTDAATPICSAPVATPIAAPTQTDATAAAAAALTAALVAATKR